MMWLLWTSLALLLALLALFWRSNTRQYGVFSSGGIPEPPRRFPLGTLDSSWKMFTGKVPFGYSLNELYRKHKAEVVDLLHHHHHHQYHQ